MLEKALACFTLSAVAGLSFALGADGVGTVATVGASIYLVLTLRAMNGDC